MLRHFLNSKIHRATVTDANLNYVGSITIDEEFLEKANILEWEKVEILNINNGERFQTYAIKGARGSKCFCLNGAAARKAQPGDNISKLKKSKKKKFTINIKNMGVNIDKNEYYEIVKSNSAFPERGL